MNQLTRSKSWQELRNKLEEDQTMQSPASGTQYTGKQIQKRLEEEILSMKKEGEKPSNPAKNTRPVPRIEDENGNRFIRELVDQEWYDQLTNNKGYFGGGKDTFRHYSPEEKSMPHQGWKLRVTAFPDEAREVAKTVLPYLQENDINHKVVEDTLSFRQLNTYSSGQEGKFITIYPDIDSSKEDLIMDGNTQKFYEGAEYINETSINSNTKNSREILYDLENLLENSKIDINGGPSIDGHNGEEKQYKDTRIHFRYAHHFNTPAEIVSADGETIKYVDDHEGLVNKEGELIPGKYIGDKIEAAERPV